jgi:hypothetical protein
VILIERAGGFAISFREMRVNVFARGLMKLIPAGMLLLVAAGCTPLQEQVVGREYLEKRSVAAANSKQCMDEVKSGSPVYERLHALFIYDLQDDRQLTKITNKHYVTDQNIADLIAFREMIQPCYDQTLADYGNADLRYADYVLMVRAQSDENLLELLNRQITIGERNVYLLETLLNNRNKFAEIDRDAIADIRRAHYLNDRKGPGDQGSLEEAYTYPTVNLPRQPSPTAQAERDRQAPAPSPSQGANARCRFEGSSIRCD